MADYRRIQTPDLLKGMAVILMIQVHIMELFARQEVYDGAAGMVSLFLGGVPAAPVFMMAMGYFIAFRMKSPGVIIKRGISLFAAGMLLNVGLNAHLIFNMIFAGWGATVNIWHYIFGADILHLAGLSLVMTGLGIRLFKTDLLPWVLVLAIIFLVTGFIKPYSGDIPLVQYLLAFVYSDAPWSYFPLLPWFAYPITGYLFHALQQKYRDVLAGRTFQLVIFGVLSVFLAFTLKHAAVIMHDLEAYYHHGGSFFAWAVAFTCWWLILASFAEKHYGRTMAIKYVKWLGMHVTTAYVFQWLIIGNMATSVYKTFSLHTSVIWFAVILIFTSLLTMTWNKLKRRYPLNFLSL